jgi:multidrug efflux system outer membrane protein
MSALISKNRFGLGLRTGVALACLTLVSACAVSPDPVSTTEQVQGAQKDLSTMFVDQDAVTGPVSIYEATARALKYNLDRRVKLMEELVAKGDHDLTRYTLLPMMSASAKGSHKSDPSASNNVDIKTQNKSTSYTQSSDRDVWTTQMEIAWNVLDFGVSYFTSKQKANAAYIAQVRQRKAIQNIITDVRSAFWRAAVAQRHLNSVERTLARVDRALATADATRGERLESPIDALSYQRQLLETKQQLVAAQRRLVLAKTELAALMNIRPGTQYDLKLPDASEPALPSVGRFLPQLEHYAMAKRPEIDEERYQERIQADAVKKEIFRLVPGIKVSAGHDYDTNSFLYHNSWFTLGYAVTVNMVDWISGPGRIMQAMDQEDLAAARRMAVNMAVLTQLNVAVLAYHLSSEDYKIARSISTTSERINAQIKAQMASGTASELAQISNEAAAVLTAVSGSLAYANLQEAYGRVINSAGMHPVPMSFSSDNLKDVAAEVEAQMKRHDAGKFDELEVLKLVDAK